MMELSLNNLKDFLKQKLHHPARYQHSLEVLEIAQNLASYYPKISLESIEISALLHDIAKFITPEEALAYAKTYQKNLDDYLNYPHILHGPIGALILKHELQINNNHILEAVEYHTTGKKDLGLVGIILYISDFIASFKHYKPKDADDLFLSAQTNLFKTALLICSKTLERLISHRKPLHPLSFEFYHWLILQQNNASFEN